MVGQQEHYNDSTSRASHSLVFQSYRWFPITCPVLVLQVMEIHLWKWNSQSVCILYQQTGYCMFRVLPIHEELCFPAYIHLRRMMPLVGIATDG